MIEPATMEHCDSCPMCLLGSLELPPALFPPLEALPMMTTTGNANALTDGATFDMRRRCYLLEDGREATEAQFAALRLNMWPHEVGLAPLPPVTSPATKRARLLEARALQLHKTRSLWPEMANPAPPAESYAGLAFAITDAGREALTAEHFDAERAKRRAQKAEEDAKHVARQEAERVARSTARRQEIATLARALLLALDADL